MRLALAFLLAGVLALGCGGSQSGADHCLQAQKDGPPASDVECQAGTTRARKIERLGGRRVPTATGRADALSELAVSLWCTDSDGNANGPFVGLDSRGRVIRSGRSLKGSPDGVWVAWTAAASPRAITTHRGGKLTGETLCR